MDKSKHPPKNKFTILIFTLSIMIKKLCYSKTLINNVIQSFSDKIMLENKVLKSVHACMLTKLELNIAHILSVNYLLMLG